MYRLPTRFQFAVEKYSFPIDAASALKVAKAPGQNWPAVAKYNSSQHTPHACTWCPRTISQCGQGDAAKLPSMQQPPREIVSQQSQSRPGREGLPFHFQHAASTRADSTVDAQEHR